MDAQTLERERRAHNLALEAALGGLDRETAYNNALRSSGVEPCAELRAAHLRRVSFVSRLGGDLREFLQEVGPRQLAAALYCADALLLALPRLTDGDERIRAEVALGLLARAESPDALALVRQRLTRELDAPDAPQAPDAPDFSPPQLTPSQGSAPDATPKPAPTLEDARAALEAVLEAPMVALAVSQLDPEALPQDLAAWVQGVVFGCQIQRDAAASKPKRPRKGQEVVS